MTRYVKVAVFNIQSAIFAYHILECNIMLSKHHINVIYIFDLSYSEPKLLEMEHIYLIFSPFLYAFKNTFYFCYFASLK